MSVTRAHDTTQAEHTTKRESSSRRGSAQPDTARLASDLRVVLGQLMRRLRAEHRFSISHGAVLGRLDREGPQSVSELAAAERIRPQSMAQTVGELEVEGFVSRSPDSNDRRRAVVELTESGRVVLELERRQREGWLAQAIADEFSDEEQHVVAEAVRLLQRLAEA
jgi:DNA-binding MarR family transcriptional regulator